MKKAVLFVFIAIAAFAQSFDAAAVEAMITASMKAWEVPGVAVGIVHGDEVVYLKGLGVRDVNSRQPVTPDSLFAIASTSKAFTTTAMAMLVDDGKMAWDDPVSKHIPYFRLSDPLASDNVTLRDIVSHRTGLSRNDMLWYNSPWSREEIIHKIGLVKLNKPFRTTYQYQNIMFTTAGEAVGLISHSSWEQFVQKRIFGPLGMTGADFSVKVAENAADHCTPHVKDKEQKLKTVPWMNVDNIGSAGAINAGARDMSKWVSFQLGDGTWQGKRLVSAANLAETHTPQMPIRIEGAIKDQDPDSDMMAYGLAWRIQDYRGHLMVSHGGSLPGYRTQVTLLPHEKWGMVILSNLGGSQMPEALRNKLVDSLLQLPKTRDWDAYNLALEKKAGADARKKREEHEAKRHKDTRPSRELAAYTGAYEEPAYGTARVTLENGALMLEWSKYRVPLAHFHFKTFTPQKEQRLEDEQIAFDLGADGDVASMRFLDVTFTAMKRTAGARQGAGMQ